MLTFQELAALLPGSQVVQQPFPEASISELATDTRAALLWSEALFFAIPGQRNDGHQYLQAACDRGCRNLIVERSDNLPSVPCNVLVVPHAVRAMQQLAIYNRGLYSYPVVGITGSNGKTIVKEWLSQLLANQFSIVKSPGSYNSQIGVPLSVWNMAGHHNLALFEAGISTVGEMPWLEAVIKPDFGIFTNLGSAHEEGFASPEEKLREKCLLFTDCPTVIADANDAVFPPLQEVLGNDRLVGWHLHALPAAHMYRFDVAGYSPIQLYLPFTDAASLQNVGHCLALATLLDVSAEVMQEGVLHLRNQPMRLELKRGINNCYLVDDSYSNDLESLAVALAFMSRQPLRGRSKMAIVSEPAQTKLPPHLLHEELAQLFRVHHIDQVWAVGGQFAQHAHLYHIPLQTFADTAELLAWLPGHAPADQVILVKGARRYRLEQVGASLAEKVHGTVMEINLNALLHNFNYYRSLLPRQTKIMVMVKAFAYGSGSFEVANLLQHHRADYLAVAYTDEGIDLRRQGITLPIMVMNATIHQAEALVRYRLEPAVFSLPLLEALGNYLQGHQASLSVHLEFDTGMRRLGLELDQTDAVLAALAAYPSLKVAGLFSHLAGADEEIHNEFSRGQIARFEALSQRITEGLGYRPLCHILNSAGIVRFPDASMDMVRLGIGLYGVEVNDLEQHRLLPVATLKTVVSQIKDIASGETVGYGRKGRADHPKRIATIALGYADGFSRAFSNGVGQVLFGGRPAPVIGNVCMDMTMVDITHLPDVQEGDEVIIFGPGQPIWQVAARIKTIPYEVLTDVSTRVKRVFVQD